MQPSYQLVNIVRSPKRSKRHLKLYVYVLYRRIEQTDFCYVECLKIEKVGMRPSDCEKIMNDEENCKADKIKYQIDGKNSP